MSDKRICKSDNKAYTLKELVDYFGQEDGQWYWDNGTPATPPEKRWCEADGMPYTLKELLDYFGKEDGQWYWDNGKPYLGSKMGNFDDSFTRTDAAVQKTHAEGCEWLSLGEMVPACVFSQVRPDDLHQGQLGDCWLISAMASLAEYSDAVESLITEDGDHYVVNLYSFKQGSFQRIEVNDKVPTKNWRPMFAQPSKSGEIWPCLIEKAFAKIGDGYRNLKGGWPIFALGAMKGSTDLYLYQQPGAQGNYKCFKPIFTEDNMASGVSWKAGEEMSMDGMFNELLSCNVQEFLMCAGSNAGSDTHISGQGVVQGHAYTILDVRDCPGGSDFKLLQLRNPWGKGEWTGPWADDSPEWEQNPKVAEELNPQDKDDGAFWMPWNAFQAQYSSIYICKKHRGCKKLWQKGNP